MEIAQEMVGEVLVVGPKGRLDTETSGELELALHDAFEGGKFHFLVDMSGIGYVSSAGLRVLLSLAKKLESGIGSIRLCGLNPTVKQVFDLSGFTSLFKISATRADAIKIMPQAQVATKPAPAAAAPVAAAPAPAAPAPVAPKPAPVAAAPVVAAPAPAARSAADLLGASSKPAGSAADLAASLLGGGKAASAPAATPKPALDQATNLLMPSVTAALAGSAPAPAAASPAPVAPPKPAAPAPAETAPAAAAPKPEPKPEPKPAPTAPAAPAATPAPGPATGTAKKGSWSKLFKE